MHEPQRIISASLLRLRTKSPFFATLALFARFVPTSSISTAATDGKDIFFNPDYLLSLPIPQQDGLLLHEVLHAALLHCLRRGVRDRQLWNIAADIVVNGMIIQQGVFELPPGGLRDRQIEAFSVEEIYELLLKQNQSQLSLPNPDLLDPSPNSAAAGQDLDQSQLNSPQVLDLPVLDSLLQTHKAALEAHWKNALQQAAVIARTTNQGKIPVGLERELGALTTAQIDWRSYLWRYLVQTPTDFQGFDRRFIGQGLYLETLIGESVQVFVAVDTSGSIDSQELQLFLSEVAGILNAYPHIQCDLYYVDAEAYGPYELNPDRSIPNPQGGGGTSFIPFFEQVDSRWDRQTQSICVYLTDGYGSFPELAPELPVLWIVTPGGAESTTFPFGEVVRLLTH
jgi:predicted metal-dependent peptidase